MQPRRAPAGAAPADDALWPSWTPFVEAAVAMLLAALVASESRPGLSVGARLALVAVPVAAWLVCAFTHQPPFVVRAALIIGAVTVLLLYPAKYDAAPFFFVLLIGESASLVPMWQSGTITGISSAVLVSLQLSGRWDDGAVIWLLAFGFTWAGVALLQSRFRLITESGARAATEERQRIARELHDVVAHSLAVTMLHLTGARLALERDPADAAHALLEAERLGRQSLAEIRRTVGLLAPGADELTAALPTACDIPALVHGVADAGLAVELRCDGDLATVPAGAGLNLYRIVQESLANVVKHTPGADARVDICVNAATVSVDVRNPLVTVARTPRPNDDGGMGQGGMGLVMMRERAELLGGTLRAGPDGDTWRVHIDVPKQLQP